MPETRIAIVDGARSPFARAWSSLGQVDPVSLSTQVARELLFRNEVHPDWVDHVIWGTVITVPASPNVAREVALNLNLYRTPGFSISRACASGFQSVANAAQLIQVGQAELCLAGGVDVASFAPVPHRKEVIDTLQKAQKAKGLNLLKIAASVNPLKLVPQPPALAERYTGLTMGQHAEEMAQNFSISRAAQDAFAIESHRRAAAATGTGLISPQIIDITTPTGIANEDNLIRPAMDPAKVAKLRPVFDRKNGTITAASSSAITDGASCVLVMSEKRAKELGYTPLGFVRSYAFPALDPRENMLLGNAYACPEALDRAGMRLDEMDLVEVHEAFAAQVLSNLQCMASKTFNETKLGRATALGEIDPEKLNVWGGSIAYGHPFAATGGRILTNILHALRERDGQFGLVTACAAGGLGSAMVVERAA